MQKKSHCDCGDGEDVQCVSRGWGGTAREMEKKEKRSEGSNFSPGFQTQSPKIPDSLPSKFGMYCFFDTFFNFAFLLIPFPSASSLRDR